MGAIQYAGKIYKRKEYIMYKDDIERHEQYKNIQN